VAVGTLAHCSRVLHFRILNVFGLLIVASYANRLGIFLGKDDLAVLCGLMAGRARILVAKWGVYENLHQLRFGRLMRIVTAGAIRLIEWLIIVRLLKVGAGGIVTVQTQLRNALGQVVIEFLLAQFTGLVCDMAGAAAHVEGSMPAAALGNIHAHRVACEAKVLFGCGTFRSKFQLELVGRCVRIMAFQTIMHCRLMDPPRSIFCVLIGMTGNAKRLRSRGNELYSSYILVDPDLVTRGTSHLQRRMDMSTFRLFLMAFDAGW